MAFWNNKQNVAMVIFASLSILYFFSILHRVGIAVIANDIMIEFNADASLLGLMSSTYFFPYAIAQIPVGIMLDRVGIRKTVLLMSSLACLGALVFSMGTSITMLSIGRSLVGFGVGGYYVSSLKSIAIWFKPKQFASLTGLLTSIGNIGGIFASSPLAFLSLAVGWRGAFFIVFFFMLFFTAIAWIFVKDNNEAPIRRNSSISRDLKMIFSNHEFLKIMMIPFFVYGVFISFQGLWGGPFLMDVYGMNKSVTANFLIMIGLGFTISGPLAGYLSDKIVKKRKSILMSGLFMSLIFWIIMAIYGNLLEYYAIFGCFALLGIAFGFVNIYMTIAKELFPAEISGTALACFNTFNFIGAGFFQFLMGIILDFTFSGIRIFESYQLIFIICIIGVFISIFLGFLVRDTFNLSNENK